MNAGQKVITPVREIETVEQVFGDRVRTAEGHEWRSFRLIKVYYSKTLNKHVTVPE